MGLRFGPRGRQLAAGALASGPPVTEERGAAGRRRWPGRARGFRAGPAAWGPGRAAPRLCQASPAHVCVQEPPCTRRGAGPLWRRKHPLHWQVGVCRGIMYVWEPEAVGGVLGRFRALCKSQSQLFICHCAG